MSIVPPTVVFALRKAPTAIIDPAASLSETQTIATTVNGPIIIVHPPAGSPMVAAEGSSISLTTKFLPPAECVTDVYDVNGALEIALMASSQCYPSGYISWLAFSPGICPFNYTTVRVTRDGDLTEATCCPMLFTNDGLQSNCTMAFNQLRTLSSNVIVIDHSATTTITAQVQDITTLGGTTTTTLSTSYSSITISTTDTSIYAPPIKIQWRKSDSVIVSMFAAEEASASSATSVASAATASNSTTTLTSSTASSTILTSTPSGASNTKLSGGAIAGIVIGVLAFFIILAAALFFWRRRGNNTGFSLGRAGSRWRKSELEDTSRPPVELSAEKEVKEMPINEKPTELQGGPEKPAELQGSPPPVHEVVLGDPNSTPATVRSPADVPSPHDLSQR